MTPRRAAGATGAMAAIAAALTPLGATPPDPAPRGVYTEGLVAELVRRFLDGAPGWDEAPVRAPRRAAYRIGIRFPDSPWSRDYRPVVLARLQGGGLPRWTAIRRRDAAGAPATRLARDYADSATDGAPARGLDAWAGVYFGLAGSTLVPAPVANAACFRYPRFCEALTRTPAPAIEWGVYRHRDLATPALPAATLDALTRLGDRPSGDRLLRRLGADRLDAPGDPGRRTGDPGEPVRGGPDAPGFAALALSGSP